MTSAAISSKEPSSANRAMRSRAERRPCAPQWGQTLRLASYSALGVYAPHFLQTFQSASVGTRRGASGAVVNQAIGNSFLRCYCA